ncbi:Asparaginyl-tRNA synthetase [Podila epicladia]|nr:Asparaginyl-tRNA synthetase [Podila epicladia]
MLSTTRPLLRRTWIQCLSKTPSHCLSKQATSFNVIARAHPFSTSTRATTSQPPVTPTTAILKPLTAVRTIPPALPNRTIKSILSSTEPNTPVKVQGWIRSTRQQKHVTFMEVNDGSSLKGVQAILEGGQGKGLVAGTSVELEGMLVKSLGKGQALELQVSKMKVVGSCDGESYPLQKKRHSFEFLREISHLRSRAKTASAILRLRSASAWGFQKFFESQEFTQVHTPLLTTHDCEGGGEVFKIAPRISARTQRQLEEATAAAKASGTALAAPAPSEFFGSPVYLTVSGQLHLEIVASALARVFTMGPVFRAEPSMTPRHLSEFWMLEAEIAFLDKLDHLLDFSEACLKETTRYLLETCADDIEFLSTWVDKGLKQRLTQLVEEPFHRMTYTRAVESVVVKTKEEEKSGVDRTTVGCVDLLVPGIGELMGGSLREERPEVLQKQLGDFGLDQEEYQWYMDLRKYGTVPHGGWGIGFERYMLMVTGMDNVRDVIPFPRYNNHCKF